MMDPGTRRISIPAVLQAEKLDQLRRALRIVEPENGPALSIPLGIAPVDDALGGGLLGGALHEIAASIETEMSAACGFALTLAAHRSGPAVWIIEDMGLIESGAPYGPGLDDLGITPERLITVSAAKGRDVLWAMEEALDCPGIGVVVGEIRDAGIDLTATRRLSLAAAKRSGLAFLVRSKPPIEASAAATRWIVGTAASVCSIAGPGPPRFSASLVRSRRGHPGSWVLEWNCVDQRFDLAPAHRESVAQTALDRPRQAASA